VCIAVHRLALQIGDLEVRRNNLIKERDDEKASLFNLARPHFFSKITPHWRSSWQGKNAFEIIQKIFFELGKTFLFLSLVIPAIAFVIDVIRFPVDKGKVQKLEEKFAGEIKIIDDQIATIKLKLKVIKSIYKVVLVTATGFGGLLGCSLIILKHTFSSLYYIRLLNTLLKITIIANCALILDMSGTLLWRVASICKKNNRTLF
jgi:hypothetical protein